MSIEEGKNKARPIMDSFFVGSILDPLVYGPFAAAVMEYADQRAKSFTAQPECRTGYDSHKPELQMWFFGLMLCEYVAGLLAAKVQVGHCQEHRKQPDLTPCPKTRPMHIDMLRAFRNDLEVLVGEIDAKLGGLSKLPQS